MSNSWFAMTREEAERAAARINAFWRARGHDAGARVVKQQVGHDWGIIYLTPENGSGSYLLMQRAISPQPRGGCYAR